MNYIETMAKRPLIDPFHGLNITTDIKSLNVSATADYTFLKKEINNEL